MVHDAREVELQAASTTKTSVVRQPGFNQTGLPANTILLIPTTSSSRWGCVLTRRTCRVTEGCGVAFDYLIGQVIIGKMSSKSRTAGSPLPESSAQSEPGASIEPTGTGPIAGASCCSCLCCSRIVNNRVLKSRGTQTLDGSCNVPESSNMPTVTDRSRHLQGIRSLPLARSFVGRSNHEEKRPLRRQPDDHHF